MANLLFINHIPPCLTIDELDSMFKRDGLNVNSIQNVGCHKRALVSCPDQAVADRLIDKYNGRIFYDIRLVVEPYWTDPACTSRGKEAMDSMDNVNVVYHTTSRSRTCIHPTDYTEFSTSRTREFVKDREPNGKFSFF